MTWATKNIALGVTTNKVRFHIDLLRPGHFRDPGHALPQGQDGPPYRRGGQDLDGQRRRRPRWPTTTGFSSAATRWPWTGSGSTSWRRSAGSRAWNPSGRSPPTSPPAPGAAWGPTISPGSTSGSCGSDAAETPRRLRCPRDPARQRRRFWRRNRLVNLVPSQYAPPVPTSRKCVGAVAVLTPTLPLKRKQIGAEIAVDQGGGRVGIVDVEQVGARLVGSRVVTQEDISRAGGS